MGDLLQRLKQGTKSTKLIPSPWNQNEMIAIRILSHGQYQQAVIDTETHFKSRKIEMSQTTAVEWENERAIRLLYAALRDPKSLDEAIAPDIMSFRNSLTLKEVQFFLDEMLAFETECSPRIDELSGDELDRLVEDLKKKPQETLSNVTSLPLLRKLTLTMANLLTTSRKAKS
jgi:hypothetical protein